MSRPNSNEKIISSAKTKMISCTVVGLGIIIVVILIIILCSDGFTFWAGTTDYLTTSYIGAFIGGTVGTLCTFLNAYLLYKTLSAQSKFNDHITQNNIKEIFISRYYELLHIHHEIVNQFSIDSDKGRQVFKTLFDEFRIIFEYVESCLTEISKWDPDSLNEGSDERKIYDFVKEIDIKDYNYEKFKIAYSYGFFLYGCMNFSMCEGIGEPEELLNQRLSQHVSSKLANKIPEDGRNYLLGHYFRQLYMCVRCIDDTDLLSDSEKYSYIKMLRAQMSDYEQILLYYNSLSPMGYVWQKPLGETNSSKMCLLCKYRIIKNVPHFFYYIGISPGDYFKIEKESYANQNIKLFEQTPSFDEDAKLTGYKGFCFMMVRQKQKTIQQ
ncbi:putative phage abortive infection protein [Parabacteroides sp. ZJ-118]|uniref:putative phage abortive infection protein n=1 Tax=Parabacteroides sp. ZJ-118 TaxID=2709398 RepID=UPI0013EA65F8|nr:putative phage abortive infection protein [Parabacteroides sp. ZJ-118]